MNSYSKKRKFSLKKTFKIIPIIIILVLACYIIMLNKKINFYYDFKSNQKVDEKVKMVSSTIEDIVYDSLNNDFNKCMTSELDKDHMSDKFKKKIDELKAKFSTCTCYFNYEDITTGFSINYRGDSLMYAASTTKSPLAQYIYVMAKDNKIDLDEKLTFKSNHKVGGTGIIQNDPVGSKYTIRKLVENMIVYSDNVALYILLEKIGKQNVRDYWKKLGATSLYTNGEENFGYITANDSNIYLKHLYEFTTNNKKLGKELIGYYINSTTKYISNKNFTIANKYGWWSYIRNDTAIIYAKNPYTLTILTSGVDTYDKFYKDVSILFEELHEIYWKEKMNNCI